MPNAPFQNTISIHESPVIKQVKKKTVVPKQMNTRASANEPSPFEKTNHSVTFNEAMTIQKDQRQEPRFQDGSAPPSLPQFSNFIAKKSSKQHTYESSGVFRC
jgi:hypothetical protein